MPWPWFSAPILPLGTTGHALFPRRIGLTLPEAHTHFHVIGVSGSGKSRFLAGLFLKLLESGLSGTLVDPHGDLAHLVLGHLVANGFYDRPDAFDKLRYLDLPAADRQHRYLPFNVLRQNLAPHTVAANIVEAMHRAWPSLAEGSAPMFDTLVQNGVKVLLSNFIPLPHLSRLLTDKSFREQLLSRETDRDVAAVFRDWYDKLSLRDQLDVAGSTLRRVSLLTFDPVLKYSLGQPTTALDFRAIIDQGQSVIVNLALPNPDARRLLGCLLTVAAEQGALSRAELPPAQRTGSHHLLIDEFSEFTAQSEAALSRMLSLTRKYGLFLVMAHQTWSQANERLRGALQNVGVEVAFRLGRSDAEHSAMILGRVDPRLVKHEVADPVQVGRSHPVFYSMPEQWEGYVQALQDLQPREAFVKHPNGQVAKVRTLAVPDPVVTAERLAAIEAQYLTTSFHPQHEIEARLALYRTPITTGVSSTTRWRTLAKTG